MSCSEKCTANSQQEILARVRDYIAETRFVILASVNGEASPGLRTLASFANDGLAVYFSTGKNTAKVGQIAANPAVTFLFQQEGQELSGFKNVTYAGRAQPVAGEEEWAKAVRLLSARSPRFKARAEKGELGETAIFKVVPEHIQYLDYAQGIGPAGVTDIAL